jgi:methyl-accepting chemotaxis protein
MMFKSFSAEGVLNLAIGLLLAGITGLGAFSYYAFELSHQRATAALDSGRDMGAAVALARATDAAARARAAGAQQLLAAPADAQPRPELLRLQDEAIDRQLGQTRELLARQGVNVAAVDEASRRKAHEWTDLAPAVESATKQHAARMAEESQALSRQVGIAMLVLVVVGVAMTMRARTWIRRANGRSLKAATVVVEQLAHGDLTAKADGLREGHTLKLGKALDEMAGNLARLTSEVARCAHVVADTAAQIAQGNLDLSQRTEEQASTLEETASSMEQLTSTVAQNADNARQASELAVAASQVARKGGQVVGQVVATMTDISQSSRKIGDIIGVIDGIAFQTNILALNAAVEAARAGEQGRGFAVVAAEVRNLAQRSAAAAKEIKTLINDSVGRVEAGTKLVDAAGKTMEEIVGSVKKVSDLITGIAAASQEQSAGIGQINTAVSQMEQVVQQNASLVEEASAATESMKEQAEALLHAVSRFHLGDDHAAIAPIRVRPGSALAPAHAMAAAPQLRNQPRAHGGEWQEF